MADYGGEYPGLEEEEEEIGEEPSIDDTYLALMWSYLEHMLIPGNTLANFNPGIYPFPDEAIYQRLMMMIRHTIDPYLAVNNRDNQTIIEEANKVAQEIHQDLIDLGSTGEIDPISYIYFQSIPYSNLPVILLNELGLVPAMFSDSNRQTSPSLYPNEWKALLDAGLPLCTQIGTRSYFSWMIGSSWKGQSMSLIGIDRPENVLPHLPGYTSEDIIKSIDSDPECYRGDLDLREIRGVFNRRKNEIIRSDAISDGMERQLEEDIREGRTQLDIEQRRLQIEQRRYGLDERAFLLDQIVAGINEIEKIRRDIERARIE